MSTGSTSDRIQCPHCQGSIKAPPLPAGSLCTCPKCGKSFPLGGNAPAKPAAAAPPSPPAAPQKPPAPARPAPARPTASPVPSKPTLPPVTSPKPAPQPVAPQVAVAATVLDDEIDNLLAAAGGESDQQRQLQAMLNVPHAGAAALQAAPQAAPRAAAHTATQSTQPAHQQAPPPPKPPPPPPKPVQIPVVCKLCGTRLYANLDQVGTKLRCPDCHSENEVVAPPTAVKKSAVVSLDEGAEFRMSDPGQRPAYRPIVEARGEYAALSYFDPVATPQPPAPAASAAGAAPAPAPAAVPAVPVPPTPASPVPQSPPEDDEIGELLLSAPVERLEIKPELPQLPPPDEEDDESRYKRPYRDEDWGFAMSLKGKDAWKKNPFMVGTLSFLFYPQTILRFAVYSVFTTVALLLLIAGVTYIQLVPMGGVFILLAFSGNMVCLLGGGSACLLAIAEDTANGNDAVEGWPDWNVTEWLFQALMIPLAAVIAGAPGGLLGSGLYGLGAVYVAPFPALISMLAFFPVVFGSMLAEGSMLSPLSMEVFKSMQRRGDGWLLFYLASMVLFVPLGLATALLEVGLGFAQYIVAPFVAVLIVATLILYFRLLGRLLWYTHNVGR